MLEASTTHMQYWVGLVGFASRHIVLTYRRRRRRRWKGCRPLEAWERAMKGRGSDAILMDCPCWLSRCDSAYDVDVTPDCTDSKTHMNSVPASMQPVRGTRRLQNDRSWQLTHAITHTRPNVKTARTCRFYSAPQCSHCKRCTSYGNSVRLSVRLSAHAGIVSKRRHVARCSLHCQIAKCV